MSPQRKEQPERRSEAAAEGAWRASLGWIASRPRTVVELKQRLEHQGHAPGTIEQVVQRLERRGYLDDAELAWHFIVSRAPRLGHGPRRLIGDLVRRGVARETARAAWARAVEQGDLDDRELLRRELRRRVGSARLELDSRTRRRVYNALLRAGFEGSAVHRELAAVGGSATHSEHELSQGFDDEFA